MFLKASASPPLPHDVIVLKESESIKRNQGNNRYTYAQLLVWKILPFHNHSTPLIRRKSSYNINTSYLAITRADSVSVPLKLTR